MLDYLLDALSDGAFHSGQDLADRLGVSRAAVWKGVRRLEALGITVHSVRGRGYRVPGGLDLLAGEGILELLDDRAVTRFGVPEILLETASTNAQTMAAAQRGSVAYSCLAERQTAGRGRLGRTWESPFAANVYLSALYRQDEGAHGFEGLSLAVGLACAEALAECGLEGVRLKWPNDLLVGGRKLGGILLELSGDLAGPSAAVIGIGINVHMSREQGEAIDQPWASAVELGGPAWCRNEVAAAVLNALARRLDDFDRHGFGELLARWQELDACKAGARVELSTGSIRLDGRYRGVNAAGGVRLEQDGVVHDYYGGELSLRGDVA